ncbi:hypothetical protein KIN20_037143 [Parelaphostrongylus tenuis]|uniref:Uncharacterized protein n=1 Tax=Parelaphostrongylus tenuis TaxID=148309 RepID=A0AAD5RDV6_PARTN|nr:hypothetical protein KIN20_037143 [Parelaphostrongylus tenuis]
MEATRLKDPGVLEAGFSQQRVVLTTLPTTVLTTLFAAGTTPLSVGLSSPVETAIAREPPQRQSGTSL